jgi:hypothetical protein
MIAYGISPTSTITTENQHLSGQESVWYTNLECSLHSPFWQDGKGMLQAFCWYNAGGSIERKVVKQWWGQIVE